MKQEKSQFDVAIIGGGPAGIMAAIRAGELGAKVAIIEKNSHLGRKLLLTGGKRSNIAKAEFDAKKLVEAYGKEGAFLFAALGAFSVKNTVDFFESRGMKTVVEKTGKIFPLSGKATDVMAVLNKSLKDNDVAVLCDTEVVKIAKRGKKITKLVLADKTELLAKNYIICTGGLAAPLTGSTGQGYEWAKNLGHKIVDLKPALVPVKIKNEWVKNLQGVSLDDVALEVFCSGAKKAASRGQMVFTHFGISGPAVLPVSRMVGDCLEKGLPMQAGNTKIVLDLAPGFTTEQLDEKLRGWFAKNPNKFFANCLADFMAQSLAEQIAKLGNISADKKAISISKQESLGLAKLLKKIELEPEGILGFDEAVITAGGVDLREIDAKTMNSKIISNLYFAGEIINLHGPTGGYNLQLCWSTGYVAGQNAAK